MVRVRVQAQEHHHPQKARNYFPHYPAKQRYHHQKSYTPSPSAPHHQYYGARYQPHPQNLRSRLKKDWRGAGSGICLLISLRWWGSWERWRWSRGKRIRCGALRLVYMKSKGLMCDLGIGIGMVNDASARYAPGVVAAEPTTPSTSPPPTP